MDGFIAPNTPISARWRLYPEATPDEPVTGPAVDILYEDDRFDWRTEAGDVVRVHWYEGSDTFGARALRIAEDAVESSSALLGVTETEPIDFYVYAEEDCVLRRPRAGDTRERRRAGQRGDPHPVRA